MNRQVVITIKALAQLKTWRSTYSRNRVGGGPVSFARIQR